MPSRRLKGLDAAVQSAPAIHVLILDGIPRTGLTVKEVSLITRLSRDRIRDEINAGHIKVIRRMGILLKSHMRGCGGEQS